MRFPYFFLPVLPAVLLLMAGCTSTRSSPEPGTTEYKNTDPSRVQLVPWAPNAQHQRIGEIIIEPARTASWQDIDLELRTAAADLGAHAVFVVWDPNRRFSAVQVDPVSSDHRVHYPTNGIAAIAIRFQ